MFTHWRIQGLKESIWELFDLHFLNHNIMKSSRKKPTQEIQHSPHPPPRNRWATTVSFSPAHLKACCNTICALVILRAGWQLGWSLESISSHSGQKWRCKIICSMSSKLCIFCFFVFFVVVLVVFFIAKKRFGLSVHSYLSVFVCSRERETDSK